MIAIGTHVHFCLRTLKVVVVVAVRVSRFHVYGIEDDRPGWTVTISGKDRGRFCVPLSLTSSLYENLYGHLPRELIMHGRLNNDHLITDHWTIPVSYSCTPTSTSYLLFELLTTWFLIFTPWCVSLLKLVLYTLHDLGHSFWSLIFRIRIRVLNRGRVYYTCIPLLKGVSFGIWARILVESSSKWHTHPTQYQKTPGVVLNTWG